MDTNYGRVLRLLERHLTQYETTISSRARIFSETKTEYVAEYAEEFSRRAAEIAEYKGAVKEIKLLMEYIADWTEE